LLDASVSGGIVMQCTNCGENAPDAVYDPGSTSLPGKRSELRDAWYCPECAASRTSVAATFYWTAGFVLAAMVVIAMVRLLPKLMTPM
jgi:rubredoxin